MRLARRQRASDETVKRSDSAPSPRVPVRGQVRGVMFVVMGLC